MLDFFIEDPKKCLKLYDKPALLNPVRKEVDRNKVDFDVYINALKSSETDQKTINDAIDFFRETFVKRVVPEDELIINNCDAIFLGYNKAAGAGTFAELQLVGMMEKPLFVAFVEDLKDEPIGNYKLWNYPQLTKLARNEEEMIILMNTIHKYANK